MDSRVAIEDLVAVRELVANVLPHGNELEIDRETGGAIIRAVAVREDSSPVKLLERGRYGLAEALPLGSYLRATPYRLRADGTGYVVETNLVLEEDLWVELLPYYGAVGMMLRLLPQKGLLGAGALRIGISPTRRVEIPPNFPIGILLVRQKSEQDLPIPGMPPSAPIEEAESEEEPVGEVKTKGEGSEEQLSKEAIEEMSRKEVIEYAYERGLGTKTGLSSMRKDEVIALVLETSEE